jgi:DMSO/TMAO reductase YedYZ molybdopterin-dependent catalytic subunit
MTTKPMPTPAPDSAPTAARAAIAGATAAAVALGVSELLAGILPGATSLVAAIGQVVIDLQPPGAKDFVLALFGDNDKLALEAFVVLVAVAIGAGLGVIARRSILAASAGYALFGAVGFAATLGDPIANPMMVIVQIVAAVTAAIWTLTTLLDRATRTAGTPSTPNPARRSFMLQAGALGVAAVAVGLTGRWLIDRGRTALPTIGAGPNNGEIPPASDLVDPLPPDADLATSTPGLTPIVIPNSDFYRIDTALLVPTVDVAEWTLRIHGLVERETTLTFAELVGLPLFEQYVTIACVSNEVGGRLIGNAKWTGVRLRDVLDIAGVRSDATQLVGRSVDGFTAGMPTAWIMDPSREPMIAVKMNDEPLPPLHGYPARLIIPGLYGYVSATKWLSELELTRLETFDGYWVPLGWAKEAPILTQSRIDIPKAGNVAAGRIAIAGVAWAQDRGVSRVEVGIDGEWRDAELSSPISDTTWVQWVTRWDATPGDHEIMVRATDGDGVLQDVRESRPAPDGARGWHTRRISVS